MQTLFQTNVHLLVVGMLLLQSSFTLPWLTPGELRSRRPYHADSPWNTPIGPNPRYDRFSAEMIATIGQSPNGGVLTSDPDQYSYPVYFADANTPRWDVPCRKYRCTIATSFGRISAAVLKGVPIPAAAKPSRGSDAQIIIIDTHTGTEYNLWQATRNGDGWQVSNGSVYSLMMDGTPASYGSRGAGVPYYAGLIRPWEIAQGRIEHALAFAYPTPARDRCVFPASKTDGRSDLPFALPEGARLQLDPTLTEADFERMGLDRSGKIIARAMQEYGMFLIDISGRPKIIAENLRDNPYATEQWSDPALNLSSSTVSAIPYTALRVLALPDSYWNPQPGSPMHGKCYR